MAVALVVGGGVFTILGSSNTPPLGAGYWHDRGTTIVDSLDRPVRISSLTWFGAETTTYVPAGLDIRPYTKIVDQVKRFGYNAIRIAVSNQLIEQNPIVRKWVGDNPQFRGKRALQIIDAIVGYCGKVGLKVIFDDQRSSAAIASPSQPGGVSNLNEALWYTRRYPQSAWIRDWKTLARRYLGNSTVIGFDLRNEPHTSTGPWNLNAYLHRGATWGPFAGVDNPKTDWRLAAEKAGNAVLKINPNLLIFVEGLQLYPTRQPFGITNRYGIDSYWWGGILRQVKKYPVVLRDPGQLVYSPHEYGPHKWPYPWFNAHMTYRSFAKVLNRQWGFILDHPRASYAAPIFLGEFGTCTNHAWCTQPVRPGGQGAWLHFLIRYLKLHPVIGWSLWSLNGTTALDTHNSDGLLNTRWNGVQDWHLQKLLASVQG